MSIVELEKNLFDVFKEVFTINCKLDEESMTEEERNTLEELDPLEILENFRDLAHDLLKFKK
jgi:hypothetical protein